MVIQQNAGGADHIKDNGHWEHGSFITCLVQFVGLAKIKPAIVIRISVGSMMMSQRSISGLTLLYTERSNTRDMISFQLLRYLSDKG